jgi:hypothetical protein
VDSNWLFIGFIWLMHIRYARPVPRIESQL